MLQFSNKINFLNHITCLSQTLHVEKLEIVPITMTCTTEQNNWKSDKLSKSETGLAATITVVSNQKHLTSNKPIQSGMDPFETITITSNQTCRRRKNTDINSKDDLLTTKKNHQSEKKAITNHSGC